jgi:hypothetical protein
VRLLSSPHPQRHITPSATEEILCDGRYKISHSHCEPSGSFETGRHSIGAINFACFRGKGIETGPHNGLSLADLAQLLET